MTTNPTVSVENITKRFGHTLALDDVSLSFAPGQVTGLLGRNGAGKTTLLEIIHGQNFADRGRVMLDGEPIPENAHALNQLCLIREKTPYLKEYRVREVLALCRDLNPNWDAAYADRLLERFELDVKKRVKQLSRGMESSLGLIAGLACRTPVVMFDEPSLGLDAVAREAFYDEIIRDLPEHPRTVVISTHLIDEVSRLFERVVLIDAGQMLYDGELAELLEGARYVSGPKEQVDRAVAGLKILHDDQLGGTKVVCVKGMPREVDGVNIEGVPLQKLFVYLTQERRAQAGKGGAAS
ncbi:MAG: ABC transporter ATP-binding protein [Christensenellaceae bacterium]|nr:ABC transporter ATP-binding protein [Christensenellaceae bacterium]MEA5065089.1 ABC transporter ATP-binding protein [Eubacteriales bacterium]MEA5069728.1 ABC transporter ATP-binding protein [Christensenellaceae bacterium]